MTVQTPRWAFFSYGHNLGDFTRALETAKAMKATGAELRFFNHGSVYEHFMAQSGIDCRNLKPELSWEQHKIIMDINRYKAPVGTPMPVTAEEWIAMAEADIEALTDFRPDGVYAGLNLSCMISVPYLKLPMITQVPTVNCPAFIESELYNMPNIMEKNFITRHVVPGWAKRKLMKKVLLGNSAKKSVVSFNEARKKFGLAPIYNIVQLVKGDLTLLPDLPELSLLPKEKLTDGYVYTGPIFAHLDEPMPFKVYEIFNRKGLNVFCSFGSSGFSETLKETVSALREIEGVNIICATTTICTPQELGPETDNFFATSFLPAHLVNELADIAVIHGGQGTVQTAVWSGTPVVGIGFQGEQQANLDGIAKAGMAIRIPLWAANKKSVKKAVAQIQKEKYKKAALHMQALVRATDGAKASAEAMNQFIIKRKQQG